jgi:type IX secretion system PorP/SprF family membrane protein
MKKLFVLCFFAFSGTALMAQQEILLSQYMFNQMVVNPAYAGSKPYISADGLFRKQWVDFPGSPTTQAFTIHGPIGLTNMGLGFGVAHDKIGVVEKTGLSISYAYHLKLTEKLKLGLGLRGGIGLYNAHLEDLVVWDPNDPKFPEDVQSNTTPTAGIGAYLYHRVWYVGISVPQLLSSDPNRDLTINTDEKKLTPREVRHYYLTGGYVFEISQDVVLKPSTLIKYTWNTPIEADINLNVLLMERIWLGGSFRTGDAVVALVGINVTQQLRVIYSYDFTTTDMNKYSSGSHEISIGYDFGLDIQKMRTPRYF